MKRRDFLLSVPAALVSGPALGLGRSSEADVAEIVLPVGTVSRPDAWTRLLYELEITTSIETVTSVTQLAPEDPALFDHPFAVMSGSGPFPALSTPARQQLVRYISYGGFLLFDDTTGLKSSGFDSSVRRLCSRLFPTRPLAFLPSDHSLYRAFFLIHRPVGRLSTWPRLEGVTLGETTPVIYSRNDLGGALAREGSGRHTFPVDNGVPVQRREAVKLGVNLYVYALTSNYKKDQAHVKALMDQGRLE
jgi:hypothetical protein